MRADETQIYPGPQKAGPAGDGPDAILDLGRRRSATPPVPMALRAIRVFFGALGALAPKTAGRLASRMFLKTHRHRVPEREKRWLEESVRRDFTVEGSRVAT